MIEFMVWIITHFLEKLYYSVLVALMNTRAQFPPSQAPPGMNIGHDSTSSAWAGLTTLKERENRTVHVVSRQD